MLQYGILMNKKKILVLLATLVISTALAACGNSDSGYTTGDNSKDGRSQVSQGELQSIPDFSAEDIEGNKIDNSIFKENKVTLVNVWATWCGPCVNELPEIQKVYSELKDKGIGVVGIVADGNDAKDTAKELIELDSLTYKMIIPDSNLEKNLISTLRGFPTSYVVDSEGKILGMKLGGMNTEGFKAFIEQYAK